MIDIHCHLVPGVDDGSDSIETSLAMIEQARSAGVTAILTTPHIRADINDLIVHQDHQIQFRKLTRSTDFPIKLGGELRVTASAGETVTTKEFSYDEAGKYVLLEMPHDSVPAYMLKLIFEYKLAGITPIIAHPERNIGILKNPKIALSFVQQGAHLQLTNASVLGEIGEAFQNCSLAMLEAGIVSFVASDAHNTSSRPFTNWADTYTFLKDRETEIRGLSADALCVTNPSCVFHGKPLNDVELQEETLLATEKRLEDFARRPTVKRKRFFFF